MMRTMLATIALVCTLPPQVSGQSATGCYAVRATPWTPTQDFGGDSVFITPPHLIRLLPLTPEDSLRQTPHVNERPAVERPRNRWRSPFWTSAPGGGITITWTNMYSGFTAILTPAHDSLIGTARTFWDFTRPSQTATITLWPASCEDL